MSLGGNQQKIYVTNQDDLFENEYFIAWLKNASSQKKVYDAKRTYVALNRYAAAPQGIVFDTLLAAYLLDTNDSNNDIAGVAKHYGFDAIQSDEAIYGKGVKRGLPADEEVFRSFSSKSCGDQLPFCPFGERASREKSDCTLY